MDILETSDRGLEILSSESQTQKSDGSTAVVKRGQFVVIFDTLANPK
jgi:hypothetical protein